MSTLLIYLITIVVSGALAYLLGSLMLKSYSDTVKITTQFILFFVFWGCVKIFIMPAFFHGVAVEKLSDTLANQSLYRVIKQQEPEAYSNLIQTLVTAERKGLTKAQIIRIGQSELQQFLIKRLPSSSDEAINGYFANLLAMMTRLEQSSATACINSLSPKEGSHFRFDELLTEDQQQRAFEVGEQVLLQQTNIAIPPERLIKPILSKVLDDLRLSHGDNIQALANPRDPNVSPEQSCQVFIDYYEKILALPPKQSAALLRYLMSKVR